ncbi:MAG: ATP-binding protein [Acidimicrobiia bacterium]|nr:ATP-binding protein [Acidimicrobiia bacterium]
MKTQRSFPAQPGSVKAARSAVHAALTDVDPTLVDAVVLMVSELTTNAILHARTEFTLEIETSAHDLRVTVSDAGPGDPAVRAPAREKTTGRGLQIVERLADQWGIVDGAPGKSVWFVVRTVTGGARRSAANDGTEAAPTPPPQVESSVSTEGQVRDAGDLQLAA